MSLPVTITCDLKPRKEVFPFQQVPALIMHNDQIRLGEVDLGSGTVLDQGKEGDRVSLTPSNTSGRYEGIVITDWNGFIPSIIA